MSLANPVAPSRQHLYNLLISSTVLVPTYGFIIEPEWPQEETTYPMIFLSNVPNVFRTVGVRRLDDFGIAYIHIVYDRRTALAIQDAVLDEVLNLVDMTRGTNAKGRVSGCQVTNVMPMPYSVNDDWYSRTIVECRVSASGQ